MLPVFIGGTEGARSQADSRRSAVRPLTHDLLDHLLVKLHGTLVQAQVDELRRDGNGGVYIGSILVRADGQVFKLDARPSDAVALAIGDHVPIYVKRSVLEDAGYKWDDVQRQLQTMAGSAT